MARKEESLFGLAQIPAKQESGANTQLMPFEPGRGLSRMEEKVVEQLHVQKLVIEAQTNKTVFGMSQIAFLHEHAATTFDHALDVVFTIKEQTRSKEHQAYVDEFTARQLSMFGREMLGAIDVGATNIAFEVHRSLFPEPDTPEPPSWWKRTFG